MEPHLRCSVVLYKWPKVLAFRLVRVNPVFKLVCSRKKTKTIPTAKDSGKLLKKKVSCNWGFGIKTYCTVSCHMSLLLWMACLILTVKVVPFFFFRCEMPQNTNYIIQRPKHLTGRNMRISALSRFKLSPAADRCTDYCFMCCTVFLLLQWNHSLLTSKTFQSVIMPQNVFIHSFTVPYFTD